VHATLSAVTSKLQGARKQWMDTWWSVQEAILEAPMDVEELSRLGSRKGSCPYYASRSALPGADLILLPYAGLLSHVSHFYDRATTLGMMLYRENTERDPSDHCHPVLL